MLKNFIKVRKNHSSRATQQKVVEAKRMKKKEAESDSDYSDSSDSEYEEILIGNIKNGKMNKKAKDVIEAKELPVEPLKLQRQETKPVEVKDANHANHFTETKSEPISIPIDTPKPKPKTKSKRVVIKKYYNYKPKSERKKVEPVEKPKLETKPEPKTEPQAKPHPSIASRSSYIGIGKRSNPSVNMSNRLSNRILNW